MHQGALSGGRASRHRGATILKRPQQWSATRRRERPRHQTTRRKSPHINDQQGTRGRVSNIEAQESSTMIREAQEAASADIEAQESSALIRDAQEAASASSEAHESASMISEAQETAAADSEAQESSSMIRDAQEAASAISGRKSPFQETAMHKKPRQQYRGARVLISDPRCT